MNLKKLKAFIIKNIQMYWPLPVTFAFLLILIFVAILPIYRQIDALHNKILVEKNELETKYIRRQTIRRTLLALRHIKEEWPKLFNSFYPKIGKEIDFLNTFEKTADKLNLTQTLNLEPSLSSQLSADLQIIPIQINLGGQYSSLLSYLHEIENQAIILNLKSLKIDRTDGNGITHATMRFDSYWQK